VSSKELCTLCRKCVGICRKTVGREAISYVESDNGRAAIVFDRNKCIACGSCVYICDTGALTLEDIGDTRVINTPGGKMEFKLKKCSKCGVYWVPEEQAAFMAEASGLPPETFDVCIDCRD